MRSLPRSFRAPLRALVMFLPLLLPGCASTDVAWIPAASWKVPSADENALRQQYPGAGAIHLVDEARMEIFGQGEVGFSEFTHHRATRILTAAGHRHAYVVIPYGEGNTVTGLTARTITPDGAVVPLDPANVFDVSLYPSFIFFSDQRAKIFTMPAVENGSVVEYSYGVTVRGRTLWHGWSFQADVPVLRSSFTLVRPAEWEVDHRLYGTSVVPRETRAPQGFKTATEWTLHAVSPLTAEAAMPSVRERSIRLAVAPLGFRAWDDVAHWYDGLTRARMRPGAASRARLASILEGAESEKDKLRRIYEWVRDNVRYVAVEIGIGGFQPHDANEVCANLYGDCKDMAGLLCMLGREAGLQVDPVLVSTWQNGPPDTTLPSPLQFNHVIAYSRSAGIWMDATDKGAPFGQLPWYDQGLPVLVVGADGRAEIRTTPRSPVDAQAMALFWDVQLGSNGAARVHGRTVFTGVVAAELRDELFYRDPPGQRRWMESYLAARCPGILLDSMQISGLDPPADTLELEYAFATPVFATSRGGTIILRPGLLHASELPDHFRSRERTSPVRLRFGMVTDTKILLRGAGPLTTEAVSDSVRSSYGSARRACTATNGVVTYENRLRLNGEDVPPASYPLFQAFLDSVRAMDLRETQITGAR
jgi:hypothetical protein